MMEWWQWWIRVTTLLGVNMLVERETEAKSLSDFYAGLTDTHPHGKSGLWIVDPKVSSNTWDTHPRAYNFSEWGRLAGFY